MSDQPLIFWLTQKMEDLPQDNEWLTGNQRILLNKMRFPKRRAEWRLGRWTAWRLINAYLIHSFHTPLPLEIEIRPAPDGAPEVFFENHPAPLTISISHRERLAFCALAPAGINLGCDLELIEPRSEAFLKDYFTEAEQDRIIKAKREEKELLTALTWCVKEGVLKVLREGLRRDTRSVELISISDEKNQEWAAFTVQCRKTGRKFYGWWSRREDYIQTVAAGLPIGNPLNLKSRP